jgi:hypothetical protein
LEVLSGNDLPKGSYREYFRVVAWQFIIYQQNLYEMNPAFDDCPKLCAIDTTRKFNSTKEYCGGCEAKIAEDGFKEACEENLDDRFGKSWKKEISLDILMYDVASIYELKNKAKTDVTVTSASLISIIDYEVYRQRKIADWNARQKRLAQENGNTD